MADTPGDRLDPDTASVTFEPANHTDTVLVRGSVAIVFDRTGEPFHRTDKRHGRHPNVTPSERRRDPGVSGTHRRHRFPRTPLHRRQRTSHDRARKKNKNIRYVGPDPGMSRPRPKFRYVPKFRYAPDFRYARSAQIPVWLGHARRARVRPGNARPVGETAARTGA